MEEPILNTELMKKAIVLLATISLLSGVVDNPSDNPFPGGYISIGYQWGKNSNDEWFRDLQITGAVLVPLISPEVFPVFQFAGVSVGTRKMRGGAKMRYFDFQLNNVSLVTAGFGIGKMLHGSNSYRRKKVWGSISALPVVISRDWMEMSDDSIISTGGMLIYPVPFFGYAFYP